LLRDWNMTKVMNNYIVGIWLEVSLEIRRFRLAELIELNGSIFIFIACTEPKIMQIHIEHANSYYTGQKSIR
jgi:hypothetical protein